MLNQVSFPFRKRKQLSSAYSRKMPRQIGGFTKTDAFGHFYGDRMTWGLYQGQSRFTAHASYSELFVLYYYTWMSSLKVWIEASPHPPTRHFSGSHDTHGLAERMNDIRLVTAHHCFLFICQLPSEKVKSRACKPHFLELFLPSP